MATKADKEREQRYETEEDLRTLTRAAEIKKDKARYKRALDAAQATLQAAKNL